MLVYYYEFHNCHLFSLTSLSKNQTNGKHIYQLICLPVTHQPILLELHFQGVPSIRPIQLFCFSDIPVALSFPHFLKGDPRLLEKMDGLSPDPNKHETIIVIQPVRQVYSILATFIVNGYCVSLSYARRLNLNIPLCCDEQDDSSVSPSLMAVRTMICSLT
jgi:hypothetical protein